ncbi:PAS domain-containing protein [Flavobacteriaceae bacterium MAR_2010_105]|nr:PAS domain-containing protein [Flavobacteriaceae bacterium MAR_2010_105]
MFHQEIKRIYKDIFQSYDSHYLVNDFQKIMEFDSNLPHDSTFFCITNTQSLTFEYISKNMTPCLGIESDELKREGMKSFWARVHPDDVEPWLMALDELMKFTLGEIDSTYRDRMNYTLNYRIKHGNDTYVNIIQNTTPLVLDSDAKPIIGLAHYIVLNSNIKLPITATAKLLNKNNQYETKYFNNFSQKWLLKNLSDRELEVVRLLILNDSSKKIAKKLEITHNTVDTHRRNILNKLNIASTGELKGILK